MLNLSSSLTHLFPPKCLLCSMPLKLSGNHLCMYCENSLPYIQTGCSQCSTPMQIDEEFCGACLITERYWQTCIAPFIYQPPISNFIHEFKFQNKKNHLAFFTQCMKLLAAESDQEMPEYLTFVPSHPKRFSQRGYNQSFKLTQALSKIIDIPYIDSFDKILETPPQISLSKKARSTQLKNTFVIKDKSIIDIKNKHIAIIDDVVTTGSTSSELARILKIAKAARVDVWCIART